jgi:hypothetical protein
MTGWSAVAKTVLTLGLWALFEARKKRREELQPEVNEKAEKIRALRDRLNKAKCDGNCDCSTD